MANLCGLTADEIYGIIRPSGYTEAHARSISIGIYKKYIHDLSLIPKIPSKLTKEFRASVTSGLFLPLSADVSADKSVKYLFRSESGKMYETIYIPENKRHTVCVSSQSGCRMGCSFCATAKFGFRGNLSAGEIVNQIISIPFAQKITHVVFMGMGEPLDNLGNILKACNIIKAEWGLSISPRNITVSTVGLLPELRQFLTLSDCNLAFSLFSPFSNERKKFIPVENHYQSGKIIDLMKSFSIQQKRRLSIAYVMMRDVNDTDQHLTGLITILKGSDIRVNLLAYHQTEGSGVHSSGDERMQYFKHNLIISGISASIRKSRGSDISAACGQLAARMK